MNPDVNPSTAIPPSVHPPRSSFSCDSHPREQFSGFCPSCLCERLYGLNPNPNPSLLAELRRTKSFSASGVSRPPLEPQRRSCDVRSQDTLFHVQNQIRHETGIKISPCFPRGDRVVIKPMKDHIEDSLPKKPRGRDLKDIVWTAASVFSNKLHIWTRKQKLKKHGKQSSLNRETQSEVADGRRSCDTDPRMSFDEPRASCDSHFISKTPFPRLPPILDVPVYRTDTHIPCVHDPNVPGGSAQTRDYYTDSSSRRRKSLDRSTSIRKTAAAVVAEFDKMNIGDCVPRDDCSDTFELGGFKYNNNATPDSLAPKRSKWNVWNIWSLIHKRKEEESFEWGPIGVKRSFSESWQQCNNGDNYNRRMSRTSVSVSGHGSNFNGAKKNKNGLSGLDRNRSCRYSTGNNPNIGLSRFSSMRNGSTHNRINNSHSISRV